MCVLSDLENTSSMKDCGQAHTAAGWMAFPWWSVHTAGVRVPGSQETKDCQKKGGRVEVLSTTLLPSLA